MDPIDRLLLRHLSGAASAAEEAEVRRWLNAAPENARQLELLREAWITSGTLPTEATLAESGRYDTTAELERLLRRIDAAEREPIPLPTRVIAAARGSAPRSPWYASPLLRIAAVLAVVIGTAVLLSTPRAGFFASPMQTYATGTGERTALRLGDGSRVVLGPESEVRLPVRFPRRLRDVRLEGTAYFEVAPDPDRPFRVHAGGTVTRVLGTRFVVRAYADDPDVEVSVAEGRVAVRAAAAEERALQLTHGQVARVDAAGTARVILGSGADPLLGWTVGRLVFRDRPLGEVARELERWYDVEIRIPDPDLAARAITLSFQAAPLEEVLGIIAVSLDAGLTFDGSTATLRPSGMAP